MNQLASYYWDKILNQLSRYDLHNFFNSGISIFKTVTTDYVLRKRFNSQSSEMIKYYLQTQIYITDLKNRNVDLENVKIQCMDHEYDISQLQKCGLCFNFFCVRCIRQCDECSYNISRKDMINICKYCSKECVNCKHDLCDICAMKCIICDDPLCISCGYKHEEEICNKCYNLNGYQPYKYVYPPY